MRNWFKFYKLTQQLTWITSEWCWWAVGKVVRKLSFNVVNPLREVREARDDFLSFFSKSCTTCKCIVVNIRENDSCCCKVANWDIVTCNPFLSMAELFVKIFGKLSDGLFVVSLSLFAEVLLHLIWVKLWNEISTEVDDVISVIGFIVVSWIVSMLFSEKAKNGTWFVVLLSVGNPDWQLTVVELASSFAWSKLLKGESLIFKVSFCVRKKDSVLFTTAVDSEVNVFADAHKLKKILIINTTQLEFSRI